MHKRILALAMLAATLATSLFGIPLALVAAHNYRVDERTELERTADKAAVEVAADLFHHRLPGDLPTPPDGTSLALYDAHAARLQGQGPVTADLVVQETLGDNTVHHSTTNDQFIVAVPLADGPHAAYVVRTATSTSEVYPRIWATWAFMLTLEVVILLLTWRLARWQAHRLARPLEDLAAAAGRLGDGDFSVRSPASGIPEIDAASTALGHTAARIGDLVDRERAITANTSHQLRTPLTGLRLGLEAALDSPTADHRQTIIDAITAADRLEDTINDLIALARDTTRSIEPLPVSALLEEIRQSWQARPAHTERALRITVDTDLPPSPASTAAVRQILAVLIDNAVEHGTGALTIHARDANGTTVIDVTDEGTSLRHNDADLFHRGTDTGRGIGLPLARSLAEAEGGRLRLRTTTPHHLHSVSASPATPHTPRRARPTLLSAMTHPNSVSDRGVHRLGRRCRRIHQ